MVALQCWLATLSGHLLPERARECFLKTPAEIRPGREALLHFTGGSEPKRPPEPRRVRILFLNDQPRMTTTLFLDPRFHRIPHRRTKSSSPFIWRNDQKAHIPVGFARIALKKVHDRDERTASLKADHMLTQQLNARWARLQHVASCLGTRALARDEGEKVAALPTEPREGRLARCVEPLGGDAKAQQARRQWKGGQ
jgi:hypothetical protein